MGCLPIALEMGRYQCKLINERICEICKNAVEDECHLPFDCPGYCDIRKELELKVPELHNLSEGVDKLKLLLTMPYNWELLLNESGGKELFC